MSFQLQDNLPLASKEEIDRICIQFEDAWKAGEAPLIEDFLIHRHGPERSVLLREILLIEFEYLRKTGKTIAYNDYALRFAADRDIVQEAIRIQGDTIAQPRYAPGDRIDRYVIEKVLGTGAFGTVFLAQDTELHRWVAIKSPSSFGAGSLAADAVQEARMAATLEHSAIVRVHDVLQDAFGAPVIVMQYIEGTSLRDKLKGGPISYREAAALVARIAEAIDHAHRAGIIHRDLEPRNILLDSQGNSYVSDFGLALNERAQTAKAGESAGSLAYMSPEQIRGESHWLDGRADVWSLGVILYELLAGRRPFTSEQPDQLSSEILFRDPKPLRQLNPQIPTALETICRKCLSKTVADRYPTAQDLADDLKRFLDAAPAVSQSPTFKPRTPWMLAASILAIAALLIFKSDILFTRNQANGLPRQTESASASQMQAPVVIDDLGIEAWDVVNGRATTSRGRLDLGQVSAAPLRTSDSILLKISLNQPAFLYVLWIDADGSILPVYPWKPGSWADRALDEGPVRTLTLPEGSTWPLEPPGGRVTVVAFASSVPLPADVDVPNLIGELRPQPFAHPEEVIWFTDGVESARKSQLDRRPSFDTTVAIDDPVRANLARIVERIGGLFSASYAMSFAIEE